MATIGFKAEGDWLYLIGGPAVGRGGTSLGQSLWLREICGLESGDPPSVDLDVERQNGEFVRASIADGLVNAVHDVSDGGIAVCLAEMALAGGIGCDTQMFGWETVDAFSEDQGRYIVSVSNRSHKVAELAQARGVRCDWLGEVGGDAISIRGEQEFLVGEEPQDGIDKSPSWSIPLTALREASDSFFRDWMEG
jgi:phosphoribosylformylglycinamidine synthase